MFDNAILLFYFALQSTVSRLLPVTIPPASEPGYGITSVYVIVPIIILALAFAVRYYKGRKREVSDYQEKEDEN